MVDNQLAKIFSGVGYCAYDSQNRVQKNQRLLFQKESQSRDDILIANGPDRLRRADLAQSPGTVDERLGFLVLITLERESSTF